MEHVILKAALYLAVNKLQQNWRSVLGGGTRATDPNISPFVTPTAMLYMRQIPHILISNRNFTQTHCGGRGPGKPEFNIIILQP